MWFARYADGIVQLEPRSRLLVLAGQHGQPVSIFEFDSATSRGSRPRPDRHTCIRLRCQEPRLCGYSGQYLGSVAPPSSHSPAHEDCLRSIQLNGAASGKTAANKVLVGTRSEACLTSSSGVGPVTVQPARHCTCSSDASEQRCAAAAQMVAAAHHCQRRLSGLCRCEQADSANAQAWLPHSRRLACSSQAFSSGA